MMKKTLLASVAFATLLSGAVIAKGHDSDDIEMHLMEHKMHHRHEKMRHGLKRAFSKLDLSDEQKALLKALREGNQETAEARRESIFELKKQIRDLVKAETIDESQIKALAAQAAELKAEQLIFHAKMKQQALAILTDEQRAKLETMKEKRREKMRRWHNGE